MDPHINTHFYCAMNQRPVHRRWRPIYGFYLINLVVFFYILLIFAAKIKQKCLHSYQCVWTLQQQQIPYLSLTYIVDKADSQWRTIRSALIQLSFALVGSKVSYWVILASPLTRHLTPRQIISFRHIHIICVGLLLLFILHGYHIAIIFGITFLGYELITRSPDSLRPYIIWTFGLMILVIKESYRLNRYYRSSYLNLLYHSRYGGLYPWHYPMNFLVLRFISVGMDYHNNRKRLKGHILTKTDQTGLGEIYSGNEIDGGSLTMINDRPIDGKIVPNESPETAGIDSTEYDPNTSNYLPFLHYFSYMIYAPLYICGPIISFHQYQTQITNSSTNRPEQSTGNLTRATSKESM